MKLKCFFNDDISGDNNLLILSFLDNVLHYSSRFISHFIYCKRVVLVSIVFEDEVSYLFENDILNEIFDVFNVTKLV